MNDELLRLAERVCRKALKHGSLLLPTELSWRKAAELERRGLGTIYPFHQRWQGRLDFSDAGLSALRSRAHPLKGD